MHGYISARDRVRRLATDPVVMCSSPATDIYVEYC